MDRPPRPRTEGIISRAMLARAWRFLGLISATLVMTGFFLTLRQSGWHPGVATDPGSPLHHAYLQATTVAWLGIVACQVGTAFAVRTDHASLRSVGIFTNRYLLGGIAFALSFAAALIYIPALNSVSARHRSRPGSSPPCCPSRSLSGAPTSSAASSRATTQPGLGQADPRRLTVLRLRGEGHRTRPLAALPGTLLS